MLPFCHKVFQFAETWRQRAAVCSSSGVGGTKDERRCITAAHTPAANALATKRADAANPHRHTNICIQVQDEAWARREKERKRESERARERQHTHGCATLIQMDKRLRNLQDNSSGQRIKRVSSPQVVVLKRQMFLSWITPGVTLTPDKESQLLGKKIGDIKYISISTSDLNRTLVVFSRKHCEQSGLRHQGVSQLQDGSSEEDHMTNKINTTTVPCSPCFCLL